MVSAIQYSTSEPTKVRNSWLRNVLTRLLNVGVSEGVVTAYSCSLMANEGTSMHATATTARMPIVRRNAFVMPKSGAKTAAMLGTR